jgi:hypothetical protein
VAPPRAVPRLCNHPRPSKPTRFVDSGWSAVNQCRALAGARREHAAASHRRIRSRLGPGVLGKRASLPLLQPMDGRERRSKPYYGVACRDPSEPSIGSMIITSGIATIAIGAKTTAIVIGMTTTMIATTTTIVTTPTGSLLRTLRRR